MSSAMLHDILMAALGGADGLLRHPYVSAYIFPVASGYWLTVFVANKVRFDDSRRQAVERIDHVPRQIGRVPNDAPFGSWWQYYNEMTLELKAIGAHLRAQHQLAAAKKLDHAVKEIRRCFSAAFRAGTQPPPRLEGEDFQTWHKRAANVQFTVARKLIGQYMNTTIPVISAEIGRMRGEWAAFLDLPTLAAMWRRLIGGKAAEHAREFVVAPPRWLSVLDRLFARYARRSDCGDCCKNCNRQV